MARDFVGKAELLGRRIDLVSGEVLIRQGEVSDEVYLLIAGSLTVTRVSRGISLVVSTIDQPGSVVGEMVPLAGGTRTATVTAAGSAQVIALAADDFHRLLEEFPHVAAEVATGAVRRAEEAELLEMLSAKLGRDDPSFAITVRALVQWVSLAAGQVLFREGDASDSVYFVIRGRLQVTTRDEVEGLDVVLGGAGRGEIVGELALLGGTPRTATVTALRATVLAKIDADAFYGLIEDHPRLMIEVGFAMMTRDRDAGQRTGTGVVLATVVCERPGARALTDRIAEELARHGSVRHLWPGLFENVIGPDGAAAGPGAAGDVALERLLSEAELEFDHLLLDGGQSGGYWARRVLGMADRVLVVVPSDATSVELHKLEAILEDCPPRPPRMLVVIHPDRAPVPGATAALMDRLGASSVVHLQPGSAGIARLVRLATGRATGLVLGGGGGRGFAHLGVHRALHELGVEVDVFAGSSMGSILAAAMADAPRPDELVDRIQDGFARVLDYTIPLVSLIKGDRIARALRAAFDERDIEDLWRTFLCVSTDLTTSRPHLHRRGPIVFALRASSSIPGVMPPVPNGDHLLVDGGVLNNLPVDVVRQLAPAGELIAVDVAPVLGPGARTDFGLSVSGWEALRWRLRGKRHAAPQITSVLMRSMIVASQRQRDHQIAAGLADLYLDLDLRGVSMLDFTDVAGVARRGYEAALPRLEEWLG